jgi:L-amino acid N-acyltransferase YncA
LGGLAVLNEVVGENLLFTEIREEHLAVILDIYNYYVLNTTVSFHTEPLSLGEMRQSVMNDDPRFKSYVILSWDNIIQGYVLISRHKSKPAYDSSGEISVYLKPACVGKRIGQHALRFIEKRAAEQAFHVLVATVCAENERSRQLFLNNGYEQCAYFKEIGSKFGRRLDIASYQKILGGIQI